MTKQELINLCLTFPNTYEDYPFDEVTPVIRHAINTKMFALVGDNGEHGTINLKCEPMQADFLRSIYKSVIPAYHMNKTHWNTVITDGEVPFDELVEMIQASYNLTNKLVKRNNGTTPKIVIL